jgi:hypothetical protein
MAGRMLGRLTDILYRCIDVYIYIDNHRYSIYSIYIYTYIDIHNVFVHKYYIWVSVKIGYSNQIGQS